MDLLKFKFKSITTKSYIMMAICILLLLVPHRIMFMVHYPDATVWMISCFNSVTMVYGIPYIFLFFLLLLEKNNLMTPIVISRLNTKWQIVTFKIKIILKATLILVSGYGAVIFALSFMELPSTLTWSSQTVRIFTEYYHLDPNQNWPPIMQVLMLLILLGAYLIFLGLLWELGIQLLDNRTWFILLILFISIINVIFRSTIGPSPWLNYLPYRYYMYYLPPIHTYPSPIQYLAYWLISWGILVIALAVIIVGKGKVIDD